MRDHYPRLFEPPVLWDGAPNPRHLPQAAFLALARAAAGRGARRNGVPADRIAVSFPGAGFGPTRVTVGVRGRPELPIPGRRRSARVPVRARATAELALDAAGFERAAYASGGGYSGPLAYRTGKPMRHLFRVAEPRCGRGWTGLGEEQLCAEAPPLRLAALPVSRAAAPDAGASGIR